MGFYQLLPIKRFNNVFESVVVEFKSIEQDKYHIY